ncbi:MAG: hypothetical protein ACKO3G_17315 [Planctomycetaceae bacterium]
MRPEPEGDVRIGAPVEADRPRVVEDVGVEVRRGPPQRHASPRRHLGAVERRGLRADPTDVRERHEDAEELLGRQHDPPGIGAEEGEVGRHRRQVAQGRGHRMDDRVTAAGEGQVGEAEHLLPGEGTAPEAGPGEEAEEVVPRRGGGPFEACPEVVLEAAGLGGAVVAMEDVHAPADVDLRLAVGLAEEDGQGPRLQRQGEPLHHLERVGGQRRADERLHDPLDPGDEFRLPGAEEEGLDERAVVAVIGGIDLDGELPHRAQRFLRGDRHAEGGVGGEGLPVARRPAHLLVAEEHGDRLPLERAAEDPATLPRRAEGIVHPGSGVVGGRIGVGHRRVGPPLPGAESYPARIRT